MLRKGQAKKERIGPSIQILLYTLCSILMVGNFRQKNNSAEDGIDGTNGYIRRNSGCSAEQKILRIPFRTLPRKRKQLGIPFRGTKIKANSQNSFPNPSAEEKTTRNSVPWNKK